MYKPATLTAGEVRLPRRQFVPSFFEFVGALRMRHTYAVTQNHHIWWGVVWGLPIPVVAMAYHLSLGGHPVSPYGVLSALAEFPGHLVLAGNPIFFGLVFGALGTRELQRDGRIQALITELRDTSQDLADQLEIVAHAHERAAEAERRSRELVLDRTRDLSRLGEEVGPPVAALVGSSRSLVEKVGPTEELAEELRMIEAARDHLYSVLRGVSDPNWASASFEVSPASTVDVGALVDGVLDHFGPLAAENRNQLRLEAEGLPRHEVWTDAFQLEQALHRMVGTACKFTENGEIVLRCAYTERGLLFEVEDTGGGVKDPDLCRHYQPVVATPV